MPINMTTRKNEERIAGTLPCLGRGTGLDRNNEFHTDKGKKVENTRRNTVASVTECYLSDALSPWNSKVRFRQGKRQVGV